MRSGAAAIRTRRRGVRRGVAALPLVLLLGCSPPREDSVMRGDALWAEGKPAAALAEYRLADRGSDDPVVLARVAHAYVRVGDLHRGHEAYARLLEAAPEWRDQAVYDFTRAGADSGATGSQSTLAGDALLDLAPGTPVPGLERALARSARDAGDREREMAFLERALLTAPPDSLPALEFAAARVREDLGSCRAAIRRYREFLRTYPQHPLADEARWRSGSCALRDAQELRRNGFRAEAIESLQRVVELDVPENAVPVALFELGETYFELGDMPAAGDAYRRLVERGPERTPAQLLRRARARLGQLGGLRPDFPLFPRTPPDGGV